MPPLEDDWLHSELLQLGERDRADLQVVVIDSHRPYSLSNIYFDCGDVEDFENQDLSTARIILLDDGLREYEVPTAMMVLQLLLRCPAR